MNLSTHLRRPFFTRNEIIRAAGEDVQLNAVHFEAEVELNCAAAAEGEPPRRPSFEISAYNGVVMNVDGFYHPVVVDLSGLKASRGKIPVLVNHELDRVVGMGVPEISPRKVKVKGTVTGDDGDAAMVVAHAKNGFEWQASIGATVQRREYLEAGKTAVVNGKTVTGPAIIARESRLNEVSFTSIGADQSTSAAVAANERSASMTFDQWLRAQGYKASNLLAFAVRAALQAAYNAQLEAAAVGGSGECLSAWLGAQGLSSDLAGLPMADRLTASERFTAALEGAVEAQAPTTPTNVTAGLPGGQAANLPAGNQTDVVGAIRAEHSRVAAIARICGTNAEVQAQAVAEGWTPERAELAILRASRQAPAGHVRDSSIDLNILQAAACRHGGMNDEQLTASFTEQQLDAAHRRFQHGLGLQEFFLEAAWMQGYHGRTFRGHGREVLRAAFSSVDLPGILANTANKFLLMGFMNVEGVWRVIAARKSVNDFKQVTSYRMTGGFEFEEVGASGEIPMGEVDEESFTNQARTYGIRFAITRKDWRNDDLGALTAVPRKIGRGGGLKFNKVFWAKFLNNTTFFTSARGNYFEGASTNLQSSSLTTAVKKFRDMVDPDGDPIGTTPKILLVSSSDEVTADELYVSTNNNSGGAASTAKIPNRNTHAGKYQPYVSSYLNNANLTGYSETAWYLLADPEDLPVIEAVFLDGNEQPTIETAEADFSTLGVQMRGYLDFGVELQDYRGGVKSKGAA